MTDMSIDDELKLIRKNRAPSRALQEGLQGLSDTFRAATTPANPEQATPAPAAEAARPSPPAKTPAEIDAELGLPPVETGLAPLPAEDPGFLDVFSAAWRSETIRTDAWNNAAVRRMDLVAEMYQKLPERERQRIGREFVRGQGWRKSSKDVVAAAARVAGESPDAAATWAGFPLTAEALDERILSDRIADLDEAEAITGQADGWLEGFAAFAGSGLRGLTDETSVLLAPFGLEGSVWRKIAGEFALGVAGEAAIIPKEQRVAKELGLPDPDVATRLATGGIFGGLFGAGFHVLGKGLNALKARAEGRSASLRETLPEGADRIDHEAAVDAAEAQLRGDQTVQERIGLEGGARAETPPKGSMGDILGEPTLAKVVTSYGDTTTRNQPVDTVLETRLSEAVGAVYGPGYEVRVYSGGQPTATEGGARKGSTRHDHGKAADVYIFGPDGKQVTGDGLAPLGQFWAAQKFGGVGMEMHGGGIHLDMHETPPAGGGMAWNYAGDDGGQYTPAQAAAIEAGLRGEMPELKGTWNGKKPSASAPALPPIGPDAPAGWTEQVRNGVLATESGGDFDALFAYQNRKGGKWSHVKPSKMTVDQWLEFQDPNGEYAQWVKAHRPDPENGVATPMGGYMIVGDTLRMLKRELGLKGDEVMTAEFQEFLAQQIYLRQGTGAWQGYKGPRDSFTPDYDGPAPDMGNTSRGYTGQGQVAVGDDTRIDVDYEVVDYHSLIKASGDLQPRDRSRINSDEWVASTAARLDPAQLMPSPTADRGTPIVGPDNVIESGNGRSMAIARAYERHPDRAAAYRGAIEAAGYRIPEGVEQPVLIARRKTELTPEARRRLVIDAQDSGVAQMTPTEVARATAQGLNAPILSRLDPAHPLGADANGGFVRAALATLPRSARNAMFDPGGALNALGQRQLKEALFARAWPDPDILARYTEGAPAELKSLMEALETAAPNWAALKADIEAGLVAPEMDIGGFVLDAMRLIGAARELAARGTSMAKAVAELLDEVDMLEGAVSPLTAALVRKMWRNGRAAPADEVAAFLTRYADDARKAGAAGGMFDAASPRDVLRAIDRETFRDLPEDFGTARGFAIRADSEAPPEAVAEPVDPGYDQGARSPEAEAADAEIVAELRAGDPATAAEAAPVSYYVSHPVERPVELIEHDGTTIRSYGVVGGDQPFEFHEIILPGGKNLTAGIEKRGPVLRVINIENIEGGLGTKAFNSVGTAALRRLLAAYRALDPEIRAIAGERIGGARRGGGWSMRAGQDVVVPLRGETGPFGPIFREEVGDPTAAIARLMRERRGEVPDAFAIPDGQIGNASLVYGTEKFGLRHIQKDHPEMIARLPDLLRKGRVETDPQGQPRLYIVDDADPANVAVVRLDWDGADKRWLVTAFQDDWGKFARDRKEAYRTDLTDARDPASSGQPKDSPTSSAKQEADPIRAALAAARADLGEFADLEIDLPDGTKARAGDIFDDLDADRAADEAINTCLLDPAAAFLKGAAT